MKAVQKGFTLIELMIVIVRISSTYCSSCIKFLYHCHICNTYIGEMLGVEVYYRGNSFQKTYFSNSCTLIFRKNILAMIQIVLT